MWKEANTVIDIRAKKSEMLKLIKVIKLHCSDMCEACSWGELRSCYSVNAITDLSARKSIPGWKRPTFSFMDWLNSTGIDGALWSAIGHSKELRVELDGPYEPRDNISDLIFRDMASAAPGSTFTAHSCVDTDYENYELEAEYANKILTIRKRGCDNDYLDQEFACKNRKICTPEMFRQIFALTEEQFDSDAYDGFLVDYSNYGNQYPIDEFRSYFEGYNGTESEFQASMEKFDSLILSKDETDNEYYNDPDGWVVYRYDPFKRELIK